MVTLVCGIPASGKSTFAESLGVAVVSEDGILKEVTGAPDIKSAAIANQEDHVDVDGVLLGRIRDGVVVDGLFSTVDDRRRVVERCRSLGLRVRCVWIFCDLRVAKGRNASRVFPVEDGEMNGLYMSFEVPSEKEGFDGIAVVGAGDIMSDIYLVKKDDVVTAYGDEASVDGKTPDMTISMEEWISAGCFARIENGEIVLGKSDAQKDSEYAEIIRNERYLRLRQCDKISPMRWNAMTEEQRQAWTDYRVALLDIPQQDGFPWGGDVSKVPWPVKPE